MKTGDDRWRLSAIVGAGAICSLIVAVSSCGGGPAGPGDGRLLGVIAFHGHPVVVEVPDTVDAGEPFEVSVRTYGGGCLTKGDTEVEIRGRRVDVVPYDVHSGENICTDNLAVFDHRVTVTIAEPGPAEVRIRGNEMPADKEVVVTREVVVE